MVEDFLIASGLLSHEGDAGYVGERLSEVEIVSGGIGPDARAIGGAALPLIKNFARDREVLFKDAMNQVS